jgi:S-adenosylmethionine hydrolase
MTDFGVRDGAVSEVKGVAYGVSPSLLISDLTHEIPAGDIPLALLDGLGVAPGEKLTVEIYRGGTLVDKVVAPYAKTFGDVPKGQPLVYINSLLNVSLALNLGDYAHDHGVASGADWSIRIHR